MLTRVKTLVVCLAGATLAAGCSFPDTPEEKATWFFDHGKEKIVDSIEDQDVSDATLKQVKQTIEDHRGKVEPKLAAFAEQSQNSMKALFSGESTEALLEQENRLHTVRQEALRAIGAMHADLEQVVGSETWAAANKQRREEFEEHTEEDED